LHDSRINQESETAKQTSSSCWRRWVTGFKSRLFLCCENMYLYLLYIYSNFPFNIFFPNEKRSCLIPIRKKVCFLEWFSNLKFL